MSFLARARILPRLRSSGPTRRAVPTGNFGLSVRHNHSSSKSGGRSVAGAKLATEEKSKRHSDANGVNTEDGNQQSSATSATSATSEPQTKSIPRVPSTNNIMARELFLKSFYHAYRPLPIMPHHQLNKLHTSDDTAAFHPQLLRDANPQNYSMLSQKEEFEEDLEDSESEFDSDVELEIRIVPMKADGEAAASSESSESSENAEGSAFVNSSSRGGFGRDAMGQFRDELTRALSSVGVKTSNSQSKSFAQAWGRSVTGLEEYAEWKTVPRRIRERLVPFQPPPAPEDSEFRRRDSKAKLKADREARRDAERRMARKMKVFAQSSASSTPSARTSGRFRPMFRRSADGSRKWEYPNREKNVESVGLKKETSEGSDGNKDGSE